MAATNRVLAILGAATFLTAAAASTHAGLAYSTNNTVSGWNAAFGSAPTIAYTATPSATPVAENAIVRSMTFVAPAGVNALDKVAWHTTGGAIGSNYKIRLLNLGVADPNAATYANGTDLFNGGAGLTFTFGGSGTSQLVVWDLTGTDEVLLTPGTTYSFEVEQIDSLVTPYASPMFLTRTGAGESIYANGTMFKDRSQSSFPGPRDPVAAIYLAAPVPEAGAIMFGAVVCSVLGLGRGLCSLRKKSPSVEA